MRYTLFAAVGLSLAACSEPAQMSDLYQPTSLYVVGYGDGQLDGVNYDNQILVVVGPLPYGMEQCRPRAQQHEFVVNQNTPDGFSMQVACEYHVERPIAPGLIYVQQ